ncbi:oxygenase MpaB family protein, partial [Pseudomonas sp. 79_C]|uniref:oxygenase MpaB family protein n=1 Tax=Pseudomonas sp. 79_C TaxID=2813567 RepID=UPI001A9ED3C1
VMSLTGLALGQLDLESPKGDPGLFGPHSISWQVHGDFPSMLVGGISALMLQLLHPLALAGVWDHSNFREDLLGRLRRTSQFISGTTFGATRDAEWLIDKVRTIHLQVTGTAPDGRPYAASDPDLLTWVHVAEVSSFLAAHLRYRNPHLARAEHDAYYA